MSGIGWSVTLGLTLGVVSLSVSLAPKDSPSEQPSIPQVENYPDKQPSPNVSYHQAPESWCLGMRYQWKVRQQHFNTDDESIRKSMEENGCFNYPNVNLE